MPATQLPDSASFEALIEPYRAELHAHCYRMLGSVHDAEDAMQDALLRAWRGMPSFEGRSALRTWLYRIATNSCLRLIERRPQRVLPIDYGPPDDPHDELAAPVIESVWVEPYPDADLGEGFASPDARYEQRESIELAFVAALQHLPARQRAVLILRDVLGFSGAETAEALETTAKAVYSALQRAHATIDQRLPKRAQQQTLRALGDEGVREVVERFVQAWDAGDVEAVVSMLAEDAILAMPPRPSWFQGLADARAFLAAGPLAEGERHVSRITRANGQAAVATRHRMADGTRLDVLQILTLDDAGQIAELTAFIGTELAPFEV